MKVELLRQADIRLPQSHGRAQTRSARKGHAYGAGSKTGAVALGSCRKELEKTKVGGADGIRTHDLLDAIEARSQLRHGPTRSDHFMLTHSEK